MDPTGAEHLPKADFDSKKFQDLESRACETPARPPRSHLLADERYPRRPRVALSPIIAPSATLPSAAKIAGARLRRRSAHKKFPNRYGSPKEGAPKILRAGVGSRSRGWDPKILPHPSPPDRTEGEGKARPRQGRKSRDGSASQPKRTQDLVSNRTFSCAIVLTH